MTDFPDTLIVGLTGMSGAGKTTASGYFKEKGYFVIDGDVLSREVVKKGSPCFNEIASAFPYCVNENGELNRAELAKTIFHDTKKKELLEFIIFPYITYLIIKRIETARKNQRFRFILLDAPTLFESKINDLCNTVISIVSDYETCKKRILERDNLTQEQVDARLKNQKSIDFYKEKSDYFVYNNEDTTSFFSQLDDIINVIGRN